MRRLAAAGFVIVALMQIVFMLTGGDRPFPYKEVQAASALASLALVYGAWSRSPIALAVGFGVNAFTRVLQPIMGLTRLPLWMNVVLAAGWIGAAAQAARRRDPAIGLWILGAGYAIAMFAAFARLTAAFALAMSAAGLLLAASTLRE